MHEKNNNNMDEVNLGYDEYADPGYADNQAVTKRCVLRQNFGKDTLSQVLA